MLRYVLESWLLIFYCDVLMHFRGFEQLHRAVRNQKVRSRHGEIGSYAALCHAMDLACVFYFKRVLCLQRSAATALVLKRRGWSAELVIGAQLLPFESHAWVEIDRCVVNDKPYITEIYEELERC
jgi:Transglutaminase-like superfamily